VKNLYKSPDGPCGGCRGAVIVVKSATDIPAIGQTVVKTTQTTVLPADSLGGERKSPEFWEYLQTLTPKNWEKFPPHLRHKLYIYRRVNETGPMQPLERLEDGVFPLGSGEEPVQLNDREELECGMARIYGGGNYHLILKRGSERIAVGGIRLDGPPKNTRPRILDGVEANGNGATVQNPPETTDSVAKTAMNIVANQESQGLQIGMAALHSAADVVQRLAHPATAPAYEDDLEREFKRAMIHRMLNPPPAPDPIALFQQFATLMSTLGGGANGAVHPAVQKIIDTALERFGNPVASGSVTSTGAALVSQLPQIAGYVTEAVREWRVGSEAQLHTAQIMASQGRASALPPGAPTGTVQPPNGRPITQATQVIPQTPPAAQVPPGTPDLPFIEGKIVEILKRPISAEDAADEVLTFLDLMNPTLVDQLASLSESQLMQLFQTREVLKQYHDLARLQEFCRAFLKYANEDAPADGVPPVTKPN